MIDHVMMNHMRSVLIIIILGFLSQAYAYELIMIQSVSTSRKTFITRVGQRQGITRGMRATFTANDVAVLAQAIEASSDYAQWKVINEDALVPFGKGEMVTWYTTSEYLWALNPEAERLKYIKFRENIPRKALVFKGSVGQSLSESRSGSTEETKYTGYLFEGMYEKGIAASLAFDVGLRQQWETATSTGVRSNTTRTMVIADIVYYFDAFKHVLEKGKIYAGAGLGFGLSSTSVVTGSQSGTAMLLPGVKIGLNLPFEETWDFVVESAFESLQTKETIKAGGTETRNQTNLRAGFGLKRYF